MTRIPALFGVLLLLGFSAHIAGQDQSFDLRNGIEETNAATRVQRVDQTTAIDQSRGD